MVKKLLDSNKESMENDARRTKKVIKSWLKKEGWPKRYLKRDSNILTRYYMPTLKELKLFGLANVHSINIPVGLKTIISKRIEDLIAGDNIVSGSKLSELELYSNETCRGHDSPDNRIKMIDEMGKEYEIDRFCPHKGADLHNVLCAIRLMLRLVLRMEY